MAIVRLLSMWLVLVTVLAFVSESAAQRPPQIPKDKISSAGKIKAVQNGVVHVVNVGGDQWLLAIDKDAKEVVLRGTATPQWLRPGMAVRFQGSFFKNKAGQPHGDSREPVKELKVFTPREDSKIGIKEEAKRGSFLSGGAKNKDALETAPFSVVGVLAKYKAGRMTVAVGKTQVQAKLADDAKIDVDLTDPRFARAGDEIEFEGWHYVGQKERVHATNVWITVARPLGEEYSKQAAKKRATNVDDGASDEQRAVARKIQASLTRAKKGYESGNFTQAVGIVESVIEEWDSLIQADEPVVLRLLRPQHKQLKLVHAFLEMEGCMLPPLPALPDPEEAAIR